MAGGESIARLHSEASERAKIVGLTGGIASGKTTVANFFKKWSAVIISGDELGWRVLRNNAVKKKLATLFGQSILSKGKINRQILGPKVFTNEKTLLRFNRIVHPPLIALLKKEVQKACRKKGKAIVIDAALLAEWKIPPARVERKTRPGVKLDFLLMVHSPMKVQLQRLLAKGLSRRDAWRRIDSQMSYLQRRKVSDKVLVNGGTIAQLRQKSRTIWQKWISP